MALKFFTSINLNKNELQNAVLQNLATAPSNPKAGQKYYNSADNQEYIYNGTAWINYQLYDSTILKKSDVVNDLTSTSTNTPLSAAQGKVLNDKITSSNTAITTIQGYFTNGIANEAAKVTHSLTVKFNGLDIVYNGSSTEQIDFSATNIVSALGTTPVNRAIGDKNGNDITTKYVTVDENEPVTGIHDFVNGIKINSVPIVKLDSGVIYIEGNLAVKGGITAFADDTVTESTIRDAIGLAGYDGATGLAAFASDQFEIDAEGTVRVVTGSTGINRADLLDILKDEGYVTETDVASTYINQNKIGVANGLATLGNDGKVPSSQLPSYVDDVLEYTDISSFPTTGETGKIYVDATTAKAYRWSGSTYVEIAAATIHKYSLVLTGDGTKTDFVVTHSLNTRDVVVTLYENTSPYQQVWADIKMTSTSQVTVTFAEAPATGTNYKLVIVA